MPPIRGYGEIGKHAGLRSQCRGLWVRVPLPAPRRRGLRIVRDGVFFDLFEDTHFASSSGNLRTTTARKGLNTINVRGGYTVIHNVPASFPVLFRHIGKNCLPMDLMTCILRWPWYKGVPRSRGLFFPAEYSYAALSLFLCAYPFGHNAVPPIVTVFHCFL